MEEPARASCTAAHAIVDLLCKNGVDTFFGVPGGPIIPIFDAILSHSGARLIEPRHESYGTFAAMGFHRASGRIPAVVVTAGPGITNAVTGIVAAHLERVPMLVICGDVAWAKTGRKLFQDSGGGGVGIEQMLRGVCRSMIRVAHAASASCQVSAALQAATDPDNPGPAVIVISIDQAGSKASVPAIHSTVPACRTSRFHSPEPELLAGIADRVHAARRPLVLVGAGCRHDAASVLTLVEAMGVPFVTTPQAKGLLPEGHPLSLRTCGVGASLWARRYLSSAPDLALVLGTDLDDMSTAGSPLIGPRSVVIHVDRDASVFARNVPTDIASVCDIGAFSEGLAATIARQGPGPDRTALLKEARAGSPFDVPGFTDNCMVPIAPFRALADLERAAGPGATFVTDIGEHALFAIHYLTAQDERSFVIHLGLGSMGSGISSAVGLALADPSRRVVCICGDGGMQMAGMEILVALKHRLPIIYAVFNDARYNMVYHGYRLLFGKQASWDTPPVDFAAWAEAVGARGYRVERPGEITADLLASLTQGGRPAVLDIRHDPELRLSNGGRVETLLDEIKNR